MSDNIHELQREITATRERLRSKLHVVSSDASVAELGETFRDQAQKVTDDVVSKARETTQNVVSDVIESLKERAAANPLAVLAIGAGLGWKLWKNPPVASTLVGLGIFGLVTNTNVMKRAGETITERLGDASETVTKQLNEVGDLAGRGAEQIKDQARKTWHDTADFARDRVRDIQEIEISGRNAALLGVAGLAVAAAVGLAIRGAREEENEEV